MADDADKKAIRYHCLLDFVLDDHGWWKCHVVDDYWGYEATLDAELGYWDKYETRLGEARMSSRKVG